MNIEKYGIVKVIFMNTMIYILFIVYGFFVYYLDQKISKKN